MTLSTLGRSRLLVYWTSISSPFRLRLRHLIILSLGKIGRKLIWNPLFKPRIVESQAYPLNDHHQKMIPSLQLYFTCYPLPLILVENEQKRREMFIFSCVIAEWHSSCNSFVTPITKRFISSLWSKTKGETYYDNWGNFKNNSSILIPPWRRFIISNTLASLFFLRNNISRIAFLNALQSSVHPLIAYFPSSWHTKSGPHL